MRTRSQTKKLAREENNAAEVPRLDNDLMRIIRSKLEKLVIEKAQRAFSDSESEEEQNAVVKKTNFGLLTSDLQLSNLEMVVLHLPVSERRIYIDTGNSIEDFIEAKISFPENYYEPEIYFRIPDDLDLCHLSDNVLSEQDVYALFEDETITNSGVSYLKSKDFPAFCLAMEMAKKEREHKREILEYRRQVAELQATIRLLRRPRFEPNSDAYFGDDEN